MAGHNIDYASPLLKATVDEQQRHALHYRSILRVYIRTDDHIDQPLLILQSQKDEPFGRGRLLAGNCPPRDLHPGPIGLPGQFATGQYPLLPQSWSVKCYGGIVRGEAEEFVFLHQLLGSAQGRETDLVWGQCQVQLLSIGYLPQLP